MGSDVPARSEIPFIEHIQDTWPVFRENWVLATGSCAILSYVPMLIVGIPAIIFSLISIIVVGIFNKDLAKLLVFPEGIVFGLAFAVVYNTIRAGWTRMLLNQARGKTVEFVDLKSGLPWAKNCFLALLIIGVATTIGAFMFVIPGIIIAVRTAFVPFLIVDKNMGVFESFAKSNEMVTGYFWQIFGYYCLYCFTGMVAGLIPFISIATVPASMGFCDMVLARLYLYRNREEVFIPKASLR